jgi:hypothetical protein
MSFAEFKDWCNQRAADGCWSLNTAVFCLDLMRHIQKMRPWNKERAWKRFEKEIIDGIVTPIEDKMSALGIKTRCPHSESTKLITMKKIALFIAISAILALSASTSVSVTSCVRNVCTTQTYKNVKRIDHLTDFHGVPFVRLHFSDGSVLDITGDKVSVKK